MRRVSLAPVASVGSLAVTVLSAGIATGLLLGRYALPTLHSSMAPWILARGFGLAAAATLTALVVTGLLRTHPLLRRRGQPASRGLLQLHATLGAATICLLAAHVVATCADRWAKVGVVGALVPFTSPWRTTAIAWGTIALWLVVLISITTALSASWCRRRWLSVHRLATIAFVATWCHGVAAGSETSQLRLVYALAGAVVLGLWGSKVVAERRSLVVSPRS